MGEQIHEQIYFFDRDNWPSMMCGECWALTTRPDVHARWHSEQRIHVQLPLAAPGGEPT